MSSPQHVLRAAVLASVAAMGGCVFGMEADLPEIELTQSGLRFPAAPPLVTAGEAMVSARFITRTGRFELPAGAKTQVKSSHATLSSLSTGADLGFIRSVRVTVKGLGTGAPAIEPAEIARYERIPGAPAVGPVLTASAGVTSTLFEHWKAPQLQFTIELAGTLPDREWLGDLSVGFSGTIHY